MFTDDTSGLKGDLNSAALCANTDWDGVPHSAKSDLAEATILGPQRRNRTWDAREKARITAESFEPGANISAVARHHGVSPGLLHYWRRTVRGRPAMEPISFAPLEVEEGTGAREGSLEIEFDGAHVVVRGVASAMIGDHSDLKIVLVAGPIDFRAGINKLASLVANELGRGPYSNDVFVFRSRRMDRLKALHFDGSGTVMVTKWLEAGRFFWPPVTGGVIKLTSAQITLLLSGMDWRRLEQNPIKKPEMAG